MALRVLAAVSVLISAIGCDDSRESGVSSRQCFLGSGCGTISGKVVDAIGRPIADFAVSLRVVDELLMDTYGEVRFYRWIKGSSDGAFRFDVASEGTCVIEVSAPTFAPAYSKPFRFTGIPFVGFVIRVGRGGSIAGNVTSSYGGGPASGARVSTVALSRPLGSADALDLSAIVNREVFTDEAGRFLMSQMPPGLYSVKIHAEKFAPIFVSNIAVVEGQDSIVVTPPLMEGAKIEGIVYGPDAAPLPGATVYLSPTDAGQHYGHQSVRCGGGGRYVIKNIMAGTYQVSATQVEPGSRDGFAIIEDMKRSGKDLYLEDRFSYSIDLDLSRPMQDER